MADTLTANYGWTKPDPGGDPNTWGTILNSTTDKIDQQVFTNAQAGIPVGAITMWATATPPANWLLCNGQSLATVGTYAGLFALLGYTYGGSGANFNVPNFNGRFPAGAAPGSVGGAGSTVLSIAQLPSHAHTITDPGHNHTISQSGHVHPDPGHGHGVSDPGHLHGGVIVPGGATNFPGVPSGEPLQGGNTAGAATGVTVQAAGANLQAANANVSLNAAATGITTSNPVGSGSPVPTTPPFLGMNFVIKYQ